MTKSLVNGTAVVTPNAQKTGEKNSSPAQNGKNPPAITAPAPNLETKAEVKITIQPFEDRMLRLNQLWELQGKYSKLDATFTKLNDFTIDAAETSELTIEDSEGDTFTTKNSEIIGEVIDFLKVKIAEKRKALQPLINW